MSNFAICRIAKLNTWGNVAGSGAHTYRRKDMAPNADPKKLGRNRTLIGTPDDVLGDVRKRVETLGQPRKNAVLCVEHLLTASPEFFKGQTAAFVQSWARENIKFLADRYGRQNVVHAALHMDEETPHIVAYVVPEVGGKLNARALFGGRDKLRQLQTDYADRFQVYGLNRGVEGSKAKHRTVKNFYASLDQIETKALAKLEELKTPIRPPDISLTTVLSKDKRAAELAAWEKKETARTAQLIKAAGQAATAAQRLREENTMLKSQNGALSASLDDLRARMTALAAQLDLPKDEIAKLRKLNISSVADRLSFMGEVKKGENAIDLVKRINGFEYDQAVAWLHAEFGSAGAAAAVREHLDVAQPTRPLTASEKTIVKAVNAQLDALGCDSFRISLIDREGAGAPFLPGKAGGVERFYSRKDVENLVPYLRYENNGGRHVFVTPMDDDAYFVLLDDLRKDPAEIIADGYRPCLLQKSSWNSVQAVFKVPKSPIDNRQAVIDVFNEMNREMGDPSITGLRHPMRLAGFRNMKPKHEQGGKFPFVRVLSAANQFCRLTLNRILQRQQQLAPKQTPTRRPGGDDVSGWTPPRP